MGSKNKKVDKESKEFYGTVFKSSNPAKLKSYHSSVSGLFKSITKCPVCKGDLMLRRKHECYEYLICRKCKQEFRVNVFNKNIEMESVCNGKESIG